MTTGKNVKKLLKQEFSPSASRVTLTPGQAVRIARELLNLSQNDLSKLTGLPQSTISGIESGRIKLGVERAKTLARALKTHPGILVFSDWNTEIAA